MISYVRGRKARTLSDAEIVAAYVGGEDSSSVAERASCDAGTVLYLVKRAGQPTRPRPAPRPYKKLALSDAEICRLYRDGLSGIAIGDRAGTSASTIYGVLRRNDVPTRSAADPTRMKAIASAAVKKRRTGKDPPS
jgi:DNA-binding CsgD family transcriptional regulator